MISAALNDVDLRDWFTALPWRVGTSPLSVVPEYEEYLLEQWRHDSFSDYWRLPGIYGRGSYSRFPDVPSLHLGSWYDPYVRSTIENFRSLGELKQSPAYLVMGPWTHGRRCSSFAGDVDFGPAATLSDNIDHSYLSFRLRWFDQALGRSPVDVPRVQYFLMGGGDGRRTSEGRMRHAGVWRTDTSWPPADARPVQLYLHAAGALSFHPPAESLAAVEYDFDPRHPVPTIGGQVTSGEPVMSGGAYDQTPDERVFGAQPPYLPLSTRPDVVCLMTAPLDAQIAVAGPVSARLFISSSAPDTDFTIKLVDVHPPNGDYPRGFAMNLTDGIVRCRFHASFEDPQLLTPGCVYEVEVVAPTRPISSPWAIASGSTSRRARFHASTSTPTPAGQRRRLDAPRSRPTGSTWTATTRRT